MPSSTNTISSWRWNTDRAARMPRWAPRRWCAKLRSTAGKPCNAERAPPRTWAAMRRSGGHAHVAGLGFDPCQPCPDRRETGEIEAAFRGDMGIAIERDVGDGIAIQDRKFSVGETVLHHPQRAISAFCLAVRQRALRCGIRVKPAQIARDRDVRFVAVLLEKKPLQHPSMVHPIARQQRRVVGKIANYGIRFGHESAG